MNLLIRLIVLIPTTLLLVVPSLLAQAKLPKPPDRYDVEFRYRIKAGRNERIAQFLDMAKYLNKLGFVETEDDDSDLAMFDPNAERMLGTIPSASVRDLLKEPRIQTVLLTPAGYKPPDEGKGRVKVVIDLNSGFAPEKQQLFGIQIKQILAVLGFEEAVAYDHRGYTRLRGTIPWVKVATLLKDLRGQPSGWFLPLTSEEELAEPLRSILPIRLVEVLPEEGVPAPVTGQAVLQPVPADQPQLAKLSTDLRRYLAEEGKLVLPVRVEVMLNYTPPGSDNFWREQFRLANPPTAIEGRLGNVVTVTVPAGDQVGLLARLPFVLSIRLPRSSNTAVPPLAKEEPKKEEKKDEKVDEKKDEKKDETKEEPKELPRPTELPPPSVPKFDVLKELRLGQLHQRGTLGTGVRVAVIDTDFTGYQKYLGKGLPRTTHYVDLTAERNSEIQPEPTLTPPDAIGHGTHCALAVRYAAPDAEIVLVRIAPDVPYQLLTVYRLMLGEVFQPESFRIRREEMDTEAGLLRSERTLANLVYRKAFDDFDDEEPARERRRNAKAAIVALDAREKLLTGRVNRLLQLELDLLKLSGVKVILNNVGWNSGLPLDANSLLSRFLDEKMSVAHPNVVVSGSKGPKPTVWFQPAGDTRGQGWIGLFQDNDGNGIMEFVPPGTPLRAERWSPELNFLSFRSDKKADEAELPAGARVRLTVQWRESHDPGISETEYRTPIAPLNLRLLRQRDPGAEKLANDEMEVIARTEGDPERLVSEPEFGVYEHAIELTLPAAGRYALRVEGKQPIGVRPGGSYGIKDQEVRWELRPRLFIEVLDLPTRSKGRIVFGDYESFLGGVAVPGDARTVISVGAMAPSRRPQGFSAIGAGTVSDLFIKPEVMTYDQIPGFTEGPAKGSAMAASLATGLSSCLLSAGANPADFLRTLRIPPGQIFEVPDGWLKPK
ncbi:MAG: hypothetical protein K8T89_13660 [Planctomycetes bacterium]|nr:hypothetical protein [Planctomycetota bacterium]